MTPSALAVVAAVTALVSAAGTAILRRHAVRWGFVDVPNERSLHSAPMPRGGGVVIVGAVLLGLLVLALLTRQATGSLLAFAGLGALVAITGWVDDRFSLPAVWRLVIHLLAAAGAVATWGAFDVLLVPGYGPLRPDPVVASLLTAIWIVGLLNAYNFMDGIDGLAASVAVVAGGIWLWITGLGSSLVGPTALVLAAGSAGFLWHNWAPARIFMGDAGSGFLGFAFAVLPLMAFDATDDVGLPIAAVFVLAPFVFDTLLTFVRRTVRGENVLQAHRSHFYQRLVLCGWPHERVAAVYVGVTAVCGAAAALWLSSGRIVLLLGAFAALLALPALVFTVERRHTPGSMSSDSA